MKKKFKLVNGKLENSKDIKAVLKEEETRKLSRKELLELAEEERTNIELDQE